MGATHLHNDDLRGGGESDTGRRDFLRTAAAAVAGGVALAGCKEEPLEKPAVPGEEGWDRFEERSIVSACGQCPAGCGIRVRVVEGRAVKIEGNPNHPVNKGGLGPKGQAGLHVLYHPDRFRGPLKRSGQRGSGSFKPTSWDEAIREIATALRALRAKGDARGLVVVDGESRGTTHELWERFLATYGSPNHVSHRAATDGSKVLASLYMHGVPELPAYDWENTRYVLSFAARLFESWCQTIHISRVSSHLKRGIPGTRVKLVHVSPNHSVTAAKADEWIPIEPATYGALALGLAHVLVRDGLYDKAFVREHTFGFENWKDAAGASHRGFRDLVQKDYPPSKVARLTGVSERTIERIAHEMAKHRPALALADGNAAAATNGLGTAMAIHALNALLGNLERPGGLLVQRNPPLAPWQPAALDAIAIKNRTQPRVDGAGGPLCPLGRDAVQNLPAAVLAGTPYPVNAVIFYRSNPVFSKPNGRRWVEALQKVPLVVSFTPLPDETSFSADFILPDSTYLERWETVDPMPSVGYPILGLRQPVVTPLYDTMPTGDLIIRLARAIGAPMSDAFPWADYREAMTARLSGLAPAKDAKGTGGDMRGLFEKIGKDGGWWASGYPFERWDGAFKTPSGKFEFFSQEIASRIKAVFPNAEGLERHLKALGVATRGDDLCLPHWEPARFAGTAERFPFVVVPSRGIEYAEGGVRHLPWLRELPLVGRTGWQERIEINPKDAERLGLGDGDAARVESVVAKRDLVVRVNPGIRPGTVGLPLGYGAWPPRASTVTSTGGYGLLVNTSDPLAGILAMQETRVRLKKLEG